MAMVIHRFDIVLADLDPTVGGEIRKTRPCVVISPDEFNYIVDTIIIAPMTTGQFQYPTRIPCKFQGKKGHIVIDQLRTISRQRVIKNMGTVSTGERNNVLKALHLLFSE